MVKPSRRAAQKTAALYPFTIVLDIRRLDSLKVCVVLTQQSANNQLTVTPSCQKEDENFDADVHYVSQCVQSD
jgi:hypothetical protein